MPVPPLDAFHMCSTYKHAGDLPQVCGLCRAAPAHSGAAIADFGNSQLQSCQTAEIQNHCHANLSLQSKPDTVHQLFFILQDLRSHALIEQSLSWQIKKAANDESNDSPEQSLCCKCVEHALTRFKSSKSLRLRSKTGSSCVPAE